MIFGKNVALLCTTKMFQCFKARWRLRPSLTYSQQQIFQVPSSFPFNAVLNITAREPPVGVKHCGAHGEKKRNKQNNSNEIPVKNREQEAATSCDRLIERSRYFGLSFCVSFVAQASCWWYQRFWPGTEEQILMFKPICSCHCNRAVTARRWFHLDDTWRFHHLLKVRPLRSNHVNPTFSFTSFQSYSIAVTALQLFSFWKQVLAEFCCYETSGCVHMEAIWGRCVTDRQMDDKPSESYLSSGALGSCCQ